MRILPLSLLSASLLFAACNGNSGNTAGSTAASDTASEIAPSRPGVIALEDVPGAPDAGSPKLAILNVSTAPAASPDSVKVSFQFSVDGYALGAQTAGEVPALCNNSAQGQHIHFILDNRPYVALYKPTHETTVAKGTEHTVVCFLSRSYHESIKTPGASVMYRFKTDASGTLQKLGNGSAPMLVYSRPKGDYLGADTAKVLLDFYVLNTQLGDRQKVKADVVNETNGRTQSFTFSEWKPQFLTGLGSGKVKVTLNLLDESGAAIPGSTVTREGIRLAAAEPMQ